MIRAARGEYLVLHLQSIYTIIPCVLAYDAAGCALYLSYCIVTMGKRVESHPGLSSEFWQRRFSVQMGSCDLLAKIPDDRTGQKLSIVTPKLLVAQRDSAWNQQQWKDITFRRIQKHSSALQNGKFSSYHADVQLSQIIKGGQWWQPFWQHWCMNPMSTGNGNSICWPTGQLTTPGVSRYFLWARQVKEAYQWFEQGWIHADEAKTKFNARLPKVKLNSFSDMNNKVKISVKNSDTSLYADSNLFAWIILKDQSRKQSLLTLCSLCLR